MKTRIFNLWYSFRSSYWFVPAVMAALAIALAIGTTTLDEALPPDVANRLGWLYSGGPEGARTLLSTVAGSMITTAGVVFSITIVVLSLTSSPFGPRLLGNFMRDTGTQVVLGTFVATFIYCLLILRVVRGTDQESFVPHLSVTFTYLLALMSTIVLIYFVHHVASSIQADSIITAVYRDLEATIDRLFPEQQEHGLKELGPKEVAEALPARFEEEGWPVAADGSGYLQAIDLEGLSSFARDHDLILRVHCHAGEFVAEGATLVTAWPREHWDETLVKKVNDAFIRGRQRTNEQDMEYAVKQLVEVALRALSPGINDPFTAMTCIDWLGVAVGRSAQRKFPSPLRYDEKGSLRLAVVPITFEEIVNAAFGQIRHAASFHLPVFLRLLEAITAVAPHIRTDEHRAVLDHHAVLVARTGREAVQVKDDREAIDACYERTRHALGKS
ncbi:DUF2254 domain-containing protein [Geobacter grbiciae]|uniref:DUF2254 domain-containing protein n=1 Tax=Geobacter grbiciae TaxID=155042 RepID=UPI001C023D5D|nr:DUF2254 domain-containing protein [Geobacter grbiciae]MBT1073983.1 DUF2254 domain-containing protein [Geobacter grbiciae]